MAVGAPPTPYDFATDVNAALDKLQAEARSDYDMVVQRIRTIVEAVPPVASEHVWRVQVSTRTVWLSQSKIDEWGRDNGNHVLWTASVLVHLAFHVDLYDRFIEYDSCEAELQALERQVKALETLREVQQTPPPPTPVPTKTRMLEYLRGLINENNCWLDPAPAHAVP